MSLIRRLSSAISYLLSLKRFKGGMRVFKSCICCLSMSSQDNGMSVEDADRLALRSVKKSEWFALWKDR